MYRQGMERRTDGNGRGGTGENERGRPANMTRKEGPIWEFGFVFGRGEGRKSGGSSCNDVAALLIRLPELDLCYTRMGF